MKKTEHLWDDVKEVKVQVFSEYDYPKENIEMERCVYCNKLTNVPKDLHVDLRDYYIEGVGQLCVKCYNEINERLI